MKTPTFAAAAATFAFLAIPLAANAETLVVTSLADTDEPGTLRSVVASAQDGDVVTFDESLSGGTIKIVHRSHADWGIPVAASISIVGPADRSITLDGGFYGTNTEADIGSRILVVDSPDVSLTVENLVFQNANGRDWGSFVAYGGAIFCEGPATVRNCTFRGNLACSVTIRRDRNRGGGAIDAGGDLLVENCDFSGNRSPSPPCYGGAILARGANVEIRGSSFDGDSTQSHAGCLFLENTVVDATISDTTFSRAAAGTSGALGAAIYSAIRPGGVLRMQRCAVRDCGFQGLGAHSTVYSANGGTFLATDCEFTDNRGCNFGGAVRVQSGESVFVNCTIGGNAANNHGGGLDLRGSSWLVNCTVAGNFLTHPSDHTGSGAIYHGTASLSLLNTVAVHNYWTPNATRAMEQKNIANAITAATLSARASLADGSAADDETDLFAAYGTADSAQTAFSDDSLAEFASPVPVPLLDDDGKRTRVFAIRPKGPLDRKGFPVRHSADWSSIAYSADGGATWTAFRGSVDDAVVPLAADQRGVPYPAGFAPIGAATVEYPVPTTVVVR